MALAYNVVVLKHGGKLTYETEIGRGTTFIIRLPIHSSEQAAQSFPNTEGEQ